MSAGWWGGWAEDPAIRMAMAAGASQDAWELAEAVALIETVKPVVVVEIGCDRGGTLAAWRTVCERVYGITLADNGPTTGGSGEPLVDFGAKVHVGDSHAPEALAWLAAQLGGQLPPGPGMRPAELTALVDVLVLDGDHSEAGVRQDLTMYAPLVRPGGLILLHDIDSPERADVPVEVARVWPDLVKRYLTETIANPEGGFGWGVIRVQAGDEF